MLHQLLELYSENASEWGPRHFRI